MRMRLAPSLLAVLLAVPCLSSRADETPSVYSPGAARRGEPLFATLSPLPRGGSAGDVALRLVYADGSEGPALPGVTLIQAERGASYPGGRPVRGAGPSAREPIPREAVFLLSVPLRAPLGQAALVATGAGGVELCRATLAVRDRKFSTQDLYLGEALTRLRTEPDPEKAEQARRYRALLATVDPEAAYLDGGFAYPVESRRRTTLFGLRRRYLYSDGGVDVTDHNGIDYGSPKGSPVVACGRGRVAMAEDRIVTGKTVVLEHLPGAYTIYMHLDAMAVEPGTVVERGRLIGTVGMTGLATGPHLHWEFRVLGQPCDPEAMIGLRLP